MTILVIYDISLYIGIQGDAQICCPNIFYKNEQTQTVTTPYCNGHWDGHQDLCE